MFSLLAPIYEEDSFYSSLSSPLILIVWYVTSDHAILQDRNFFSWYWLIISFCSFEIKAENKVAFSDAMPTSNFPTFFRREDFLILKEISSRLTVDNWSSISSILYWNNSFSRSINFYGLFRTFCLSRWLMTLRKYKILNVIFNFIKFFNFERLW